MSQVYKTLIFLSNVLSGILRDEKFPVRVVVPPNYSVRGNALSHYLDILYWNIGFVCYFTINLCDIDLLSLKIQGNRKELGVQINTSTSAPKPILRGYRSAKTVARQREYYRSVFESIRPCFWSIQKTNLVMFSLDEDPVIDIHYFHEYELLVTLLSICCCFCISISHQSLR